MAGRTAEEAVILWLLSVILSCNAQGVPVPVFELQRAELVQVNELLHEGRVWVQHSMAFSSQWFCWERHGWWYHVPITAEAHHGLPGVSSRVTQLTHRFSNYDCEVQDLFVNIYTNSTDHEVGIFMAISRTPSYWNNNLVTRLKILTFPARYQEVEEGNLVVIRFKTEAEHSSHTSKPWIAMWITRQDYTVWGNGWARSELIQAFWYHTQHDDIGVQSEITRDGNVTYSSATIDMQSFNPEIHYGLYRINAYYGARLSAYAWGTLWPVGYRIQLTPRVILETCSMQWSMYTNQTFTLYSDVRDCIMCTAMGMQNPQPIISHTYRGTTTEVSPVARPIKTEFLQRVTYPLLGMDGRNTGQYTCTADSPNGPVTSTVTAMLEQSIGAG